MSHTLVLRLLLTYHGDQALTRQVAARFLRDAEHRQEAERGLLDQELETVMRDRIAVELGTIKELSGGFSDDRVYLVRFGYWFPTPGGDENHQARFARPPTASVIVKRSTRDSFNLATEHYNQLPPALRELFVRQPSEAQVFKSGLSSSYYLVMEDLTDLYTLRHLFNEFDQRAMSEPHTKLLERATSRTCEVSFRLFGLTRSGRSNFPGTQLARLFLSQIEGKLTRAVGRVPWLKSPLQSFRVGEQRYKGLDYYLAAITRNAHALQPRSLGLMHGDFHARNVMLDRDCTLVRLIDLDKLSWSGDYLADLGTLVQDLCVYRRVSEPERDFGLPHREIVFETSPTAGAGTVENAIRYPALGRPATIRLQELMLEAIGQFAAEIEDAGWKPRLWLATATALLMRLAFQTQKEPAAVLYGEGVRLLHELTRFLEQGQLLPPLLFPASWPEETLARLATPTDLPEWCHRSELLRGIHAALLSRGLRPTYDRGAVRYYADETGEGPVAALTQAQRGALARLLLRGEVSSASLPTGVEVQISARAEERLRTAVVLTEVATVDQVLTLAETALAGALPRGEQKPTRGRG
jgi:hypothetical protein